MSFPVATSAKSAKLNRVRQAFPNVPHSLITEHYLQKEVATSNTTNLYEFNFNGSTNDLAFQTENLLGKNDAFVCTDIGFFLAYEPASTSDYATRYYTWPNLLNFVTVASTTQVDLEIFWNAYYEIKTGLMVIPRKTTRDHYFAPTNDQVLFATGGSTAASMRAGQIEGNASGYVSQEPMIIFSGAATQSINLNVGTGYVVDVTADAGQVRLAIKLLGFIIFNGAQADSQTGAVVQELMNKHKGILPV